MINSSYLLNKPLFQKTRNMLPQLFQKAFTLVEILMALLIVSVILSASLPVITARHKAREVEYSGHNSFPIGGIIVWGTDKTLPNNTWLDCNGQAIPAGIEYEEIRKIYGTNLPDYRGVFLRGTGGNAAATGILQNDAIKELNVESKSGYIPFWSYSTSSPQFGSHLNPTSTTMWGGKWEGYNRQSEARVPISSTSDRIYAGQEIKYSGAANHAYFKYYPADITYTNTNNIANEVRPVNKAVRYIIKVRR